MFGDILAYHALSPPHPTEPEGSKTEKRKLLEYSLFHHLAINDVKQASNIIQAAEKAGIEVKPFFKDNLEKLPKFLTQLSQEELFKEQIAGAAWTLNINKNIYNERWRKIATAMDWAAHDIEKQTERGGVSSAYSEQEMRSRQEKAVSRSNIFSQFQRASLNLSQGEHSADAEIAASILAHENGLKHADSFEFYSPGLLQALGLKYLDEQSKKQG